MLDKNKAKLKRKLERETFVGFRPSSINHGKIYNRKRKHKKAYSENDQAFTYNIEHDILLIIQNTIFFLKKDVKVDEKDVK